jgi:hypothetical protein
VSASVCRQHCPALPRTAPHCPAGHALRFSNPPFQPALLICSAAPLCALPSRPTCPAALLPGTPPRCRYMDPDCVVAVEGNRSVTAALLENR